MVIPIEVLYRRESSPLEADVKECYVLRLHGGKPQQSVHGTRAELAEEIAATAIEDRFSFVSYQAPETKVSQSGITRAQRGLFPYEQERLAQEVQALLGGRKFYLQ